MNNSDIENQKIIAERNRQSYLKKQQELRRFAEEDEASARNFANPFSNMSQQNTAYSNSSMGSKNTATENRQMNNKNTAHDMGGRNTTVSGSNLGNQNTNYSGPQQNTTSSANQAARSSLLVTAQNEYEGMMHTKPGASLVDTVAASVRDIGKLGVQTTKSAGMKAVTKAVNYGEKAFEGEGGANILTPAEVGKTIGRLGVGIALDRAKIAKNVAATSFNGVGRALANGSHEIERVYAGSSKDRVDEGFGFIKGFDGNFTKLSAEDISQGSINILKQKDSKAVLKDFDVDALSSKSNKAIKQINDALKTIRGNKECNLE